MTIISKANAEDSALGVKASIVSVLLKASARKKVNYKQIASALNVTQHSIKLLLSPTFPRMDFIDLFRVCAYLNVGLTIRSGNNILCQYKSVKSNTETKVRRVALGTKPNIGDFDGITKVQRAIELKRKALVDNKVTH
jgi:hypothetical protein